MTPCAGYPIILPRENESVLLGSAILGAVASKKYPTVREAMKAMNAAGQVRNCSHYLLFSLKEEPLATEVWALAVACLIIFSFSFVERVTLYMFITDS